MNPTTNRPLYGYTSEETAYLVADYPYGRKVRCRIRYWLEQDAKRGFRFVAQTENPKSLRWNAPKKSTYVLIAAAMYLDENNHVEWKCITQYSSAEEALAFAQAFTGSTATKGLVAWAAMKASYLRATIEGIAYMTINGVRVPRTDADNVRDAAELEAWNLALEASKAAVAS